MLCEITTVLVIIICSNVHLLIHYSYFEISHSVHPPPPFCWGVEAPAKFSKRGGLDRISILRGGCWERGGDFFQGELQFLHKNKLKSETFNDKTSL